jgi:hypothetical protein
LEDSASRSRITPQSFDPRMQAILLTSSLLIIAAMLASLAWLSSVRVSAEAEAVSVDAADEPS